MTTARTTRRRLLPRRCGFWLSGPILCAILVCEVIWYCFRALLFPLQRRRARDGMRRLIEGGRSRAAIAAVVLLGLALSGCTTFPGASFEDQVASLQWTTYELFLSESPQQNLQDIGADLEEIFVGRDFEDMTHHQMAESLEMLGW